MNNCKKTKKVLGTWYPFQLSSYENLYIFSPCSSSEFLKLILSFCNIPRELTSRFSVIHPPVVVVLKPNGEVIAPNAVEEIKEQGTDCFKNWQEAADLVDRNFLLSEDFEDVTLRSITDPIRRFKYKLVKNKRSKGGDKGEVSWWDVSSWNFRLVNVSVPKQSPMNIRYLQPTFSFSHSLVTLNLQITLSPNCKLPFLETWWRQKILIL